MNNTAPEPGPHLHSIILKTPAEPARPSFRDLAKHHARAAAALLGDVDDVLNDDEPGEASHDELLELVGAAQAHALVAIACAQVAPVARQRLMPCKTGGAK